MVDSDTANNVEDALGTPHVINARTGLIEFPLLDNIDMGAKIVLSYNTSKSETALVNVRGEGNLDLLLVEGSVQGEYSESFVVEDPADVTMNNGMRSSTNSTAFPVGCGATWPPITRPSPPSTWRYKPARGTLSGAEAYQTALGTPSNGDESERGIASGRDCSTLGSPTHPIRDGQDANETVELADVRHDAPSDITVVLVNAQQGILSFTTTDVFDGFSGGDIEVDYVGSDSFYVTVNHGPINLTGVTDLDGSLVISDTTMRRQAFPLAASR